MACTQENPLILSRSAARISIAQIAHFCAAPATVNVLVDGTPAVNWPIVVKSGSVLVHERAMLSAQGLPRRPWFKHQIYAPGFYTGYGVKTLPAVREAIEQRNWPEAEQQIKLVAETINQIAAAIDRATARLK